VVIFWDCYIVVPLEKKCHSLGRVFMDLYHDALRSACFEAARKTMEDARPTDVKRIARLADTFNSFAFEHSRRVKERGMDPRVVLRAVNYLTHTHAIPPMHDSTEWFLFMLRAMMELACPEKEQTGETALFLKDVEKGIAFSQSKISQ
jgi:hypothetical protein